MEEQTQIFLSFSIEKNTTQKLSNYNLLRYYKEQYEKANSLSGTLTQQNGKWILTYKFLDPKDFDILFQQNLWFYEKLVQLMAQGILEVENLNISNENSRKETEQIHLILKITTNRKQPIKKNYQLAFNAVELIGFGSYYEEIYDGFLLFYRNLEDFYTMQVNRADFDQLKIWLESKNLWNPTMEKHLNQLFEEHNKTNALPKI